MKHNHNNLNKKHFDYVGEREGVKRSYFVLPLLSTNNQMLLTFNKVHSVIKVFLRKLNIDGIWVNAKRTPS